MKNSRFFSNFFAKIDEILENSQKFFSKNLENFRKFSKFCRIRGKTFRNFARNRGKTFKKFRARYAHANFLHIGFAHWFWNFFLFCTLVSHIGCENFFRFPHWYSTLVSAPLPLNSCDLKAESQQGKIVTIFSSREGDTMGFETS